MSGASVSGLFDFGGQMKVERKKSASLMLLIIFCAASAMAQDVHASEHQKTADTNAIRVIWDRHTSMRWLLEHDPSRPGGPGRMVLQDQQKGLESAGIGDVVVRPAKKAPTPVIRSGDRLVVEESSALVEARLEAVALSSAVEGAEVRLRLQIGGKVLRAVALGPGRAAFVGSAGRP